MIISALLALLLFGCSSNAGNDTEGNVASVNQAVFGCGGSGGTGGSTSTGGTGGELSNAGLQLQVRTSACVANQAQQFFKVVNNGTSAVKTSDIKVKFWVNDTSGSNVVGTIYTGGCLTGANGCYHQVSGVSVAVTPVSPACGPDANHQANREITISSTDNTLLSPGQFWDNVQMALYLANWGNFNPGTNTWYSPCLAGSDYAPDNHFAVYYKNQLVFSNGIAAPDCRAPHGMQRLPDYVTQTMAAARLVGPVPSSTIIHLAFSLPLQREQELAEIATRVSDPGSPQYRQYLSPTYIANNYSPPATDYDSLISWLQASGLTLDASYQHRMQVDLHAPAATVEQLLYTNLNYYLRANGSQFYAPDRAPSTNSPVSLFDVVGLNNFYILRPARYGTGGINGGDFRPAYAYDATDPSCPSPTNLLGDDQCIGLVGGTRFDSADIQQFVTNSNLGALVGTGGPKVIALSVHQFPTSGPVYVEGYSSETEDDIEMAVSMAPHAEIVVYEQDLSYRANPSPGQQTTQYLYEAIFAAMASDDQHAHCNQLSTSFIGWAPSLTTNRYFKEVFPSQGQTFFMGTGDGGVVNQACGYLNCSGYDYSERNFMTLVGGTVLNNNGGGSYSETAWPQAGSGVYSDVPIPSYQSVWNLGQNGSGASSSNRNIVDVAAEAEKNVSVVNTAPVPDSNLCLPATPIDVQNKQNITVGGTSLSSPLWAGFMALANQQAASHGLGPVGFFNPALYAIGNSSAYSNCFHDIGGAGQPTSWTETGTISTDQCGSSVWNTTAQVYATMPGYDLATGWGTPRCGLIKQLSAPSALPNIDVSAGSQHTCSIRTDGSIWCWGANGNGQLGNGTTTDSNAPMPVTAPATWSANGLKATHVAAGGSHTCALMSDSSVWCWGANASGQLGNSTQTDSSDQSWLQGLRTQQGLRLEICIRVQFDPSHNTRQWLCAGVTNCMVNLALTNPPL